MILETNKTKAIIIIIHMDVIKYLLINESSSMQDEEMQIAVTYEQLESILYVKNEIKENI